MVFCVRPLRSPPSSPDSKFALFRCQMIERSVLTGDNSSNEWPTYTWYAEMRVSRSCTLTEVEIPASIFNLLDAPATVFPVSFLDPKLDKWDTKPEPYNSTDERYLDRCKVDESLLDLSDPKSADDENVSAGVPICVQL